MMELVSLRQQQQTTISYIKAMEQRIEGAERKQRQMMSFLARAMQSPTFLHQLLKQRDKRIEEIEDEAAKRERGSSMSELEALALEMQGYGKQRNVKEEDDHLVVERELDDGFWEELLREESLASTSS
uniref:Heat stress transcription factor A-7a n=1 Tax=Noccaea caerulescens TaxID=107243 RepID=A0A1J3CKI8_NOCCA